MLTISPLFEVVSPNLQNQSGDKSKWKKYILPAAGLAGAGLLGYGAYRALSTPENLPTTSRNIAINLKDYYGSNSPYYPYPDGTVRLASDYD